MTDFVASLVGAAVGLIVGLTSTGAGALLTPALIGLVGIPAARAIGTDVLIAAVIKLAGGSLYAARGQVRWPLVARLAVGSVPGAAAGVAIVNQLPPGSIDIVLQRAVGVVVIAAGAATLIRLFVLRRPDRPMPATAPTVALGFGIGLLVGLTSIGSGTLLLCGLAIWFPLRGPEMVGTDLVHGLVLSAVAAGGHALAGRVDGALAATVLLGALPGVVAGTWLARALPERRLRAALGVVLIGAGLATAFSEAARPAVPRAPGGHAR